MYDDEQVQLIIEPPKKDIKKRTEVFDSWKSFHLADQQCLKFFIEVSSVYLNNLISHRENPQVDETIRKKIPNCILIDMFTVQIKASNGADRSCKTVKGNINFQYSLYQDFVISLYLKDYLDPYDYVWAKFTYEDRQWKSKSFTMAKDSDSKAFSFSIKRQELFQFAKPNLLLQINVQLPKTESQPYVGIQNEGNTCYMNSILQILYFIRPLRKIIIESLSTNKTIKALQNIFLSLLTEDTKRSVDGQDLIVAFGRFAEYPRRQQDIHEFMIGFMEELQSECPQVRQFWQGRGEYATTSKQQDKPYRSAQNDQFFELDLHIVDPRGESTSSLQQALKILLEEEAVDDKLDTDEHGKVVVSKQRTFLSLPNIVFFNVKRYEYNKERKRLTKLLSDFRYPASINLGFLMETAGNDEHQYVLYALTVHKGSQPSSGHYYSLINTSDSLESPKWCEFNDSSVRYSSIEEALSFSGQKKTTIVLNKEIGMFRETEMNSEETAYLLVYIRQNCFEEYQQTKTDIPKFWINRKLAKQKKKQNDRCIDIEVLVFQPKEHIDFFGKTETMTIPINLDEDIYDQLKKIQKMFLGCVISSIWKVSKDQKKIKNLLKIPGMLITGDRIFSYRRGHRIPDYLLLFPESQGSCSANYSTLKKRLGLVKIKDQEFPREDLYLVVEKQKLEDMISKLAVIKQRKAHFSHREDFQEHWNDFIQITFEKMSTSQLSQ